MKNFLRKLTKPFRWCKWKISNAWLRVRLKYYVSYIRRASVREKRIYYILLDPNTRRTVVCNNNEYVNIKRAMKENGYRINDYVYAVANPFEKG